MKEKDPDDVPFLTVALMKGAEIWSYDKQHLDGLPIRRVTSEILRDLAQYELPELYSWIGR